MYYMDDVRDIIDVVCKVVQGFFQVDVVEICTGNYGFSIVRDIGIREVKFECLKLV